jgi:DNA-binding CsgD family transcriptional regulator
VSNREAKIMDADNKPVGHQDRLGPVISLLYDAALDDAQWAGVASAIARAFDATSGVLKTCGGPRGPKLASVTDNLRVAPNEQAWADYWHRNDLWVEHSARLHPGEVFTSQSLMPDTQFERTGFYQDWTRRLDIYHMVGVLFPVGNGETGVLGVHRPLSAGRFVENDRQELGVLFPHVRRALGLRERLRDTALAQRAAVDALDCIETSVLVVDASCMVLYANRAAENLLASSSEIRTHARRVCMNSPALNSRLAKLIRDAVQTSNGAAHAAGAALAVPRQGRLPLTLLVAPWRANWASADVSRPAASIFIRDPEVSGDSATRTLRDLFGLTRAEAAIAVAIGEGQSLDQIAATLGVGLGTVRSHLKKVLAKTGTSRQGALAALVARSVASISPHP